MRTAPLLAFGALALLLAAAAPPAGAPGGACPTSAGMKDASKATKPSSFAPRPRPAHNAYGAPVGNRILSKHPPKKPRTPAGATQT